MSGPDLDHRKVALIRDLRRGYSEILGFVRACPPLHAQRRCIAAFVRFAIDRAFANDDDHQLDD